MNECIIGLLHYDYHARLVTLEDLEDYIADTIAYNILVRSDPLLKDVKEMYKKEWQLKDYADKRKSTNLTRFAYCPECGKKVDWKYIRRLDNGEE